jgi:levanase
LYVDRTRSGAVDFDSTFPGVRTVPLKAKNDKGKLRVLVGWWSVEVFAEGGTAALDHMRARRLNSIWR